MPLLDQPDTSIYRTTKLFSSLTGPGQLSGGDGQASGPTAAQQRFGAEQAENAQIAQLAQQYGDDYDGLINAVSKINPKRGFEMGSALENYRKEQAQTDVANSDRSLKMFDVGSRVIQLGIEDPTTWTTGRSMLSAAGGGKFDPFLPQPNDPNLKDKLVALDTALQDQKQYLDARKKAAQDYFDGDKVGGALGLMAASTQPAQWQATAQIVKQGGLGDLLNLAPDAATAQSVLEQHKATGAAADKPEKLIAQMTGGMTGPQGLAVAKYMKDNGITNVLDVPQPVIDKLRRESAQAVHITTGPAAGTSGGLTTGEGGGVEYAGTLTRIMGRVPVGLARSGGAATAAINEAARQTKMLGRTPIDSVLKTAVFQGDQKALANVQKLRTAADAYENKALAQLDIVDGLSEKVGRTKFPILNSAILAGKTQVLGDPDATLLLNAIQTASTEYAKIVMGGTASAQALSDTAAKEAKKLLNEAMSKGTLKRATALMRTEMDLTMRGFDASEKHIMDNMGQAGGAPQPTTPTAPTDIASLRQKYKY